MVKSLGSIVSKSVKELLGVWSCWISSGLLKLMGNRRRVGACSVFCVKHTMAPLSRLLWKETSKFLLWCQVTYRNMPSQPLPIQPCSRWPYITPIVHSIAVCTFVLFCNDVKMNILEFYHSFLVCPMGLESVCNE